jgi:hypothetical protein
MQIPQAPGIEQYLAPGRPDIAGAFTRGAALGQQARERQERKKEVDAERAYRIDRDRSELLGRFGADAVVDPESGVIDPGASAAKREERLRQEQIARGLGEASVFDPKLNIPPGMDQNPAFQQGQAAAQARRMEGESTAERAAKRAREEIEARGQAQRRVETIRQTGQTIRDIARRAAEAARQSTGGGVTVVDGPGGRTVTRKYGSQAEADAAMPSPPSPEEQERDASIEAHEKAIRDAKRLREQGKKISVEFDKKNGNPVVDTAWVFGDKDPVGVIEASLARLRGDAPAQQPPAARGRTDARGNRVPVPFKDLPQLP